MQQYNVTGMSCAACSSRVSKAVSELPGVTSCTVNLLTNSMGVEGTASPESVIKAVVEAGYGASVKGKETENKDIGETDKEIVLLKQRLIFSSILTIILVYFSMGHGMWGWKVPTFLDSNAIGLALVQMLLCISVMVINQRFFINGIKGLLHKVPNMDTLVSLGSGASFIWSIYVLFIMTLGSYEQPLYFESAAMILTLITCGKLLEAKSKGKTTNALKSLMKLAPKTATIIIDNKEVEVEIDKVKKGDYFAVRPGESIPVDGVVIEGSSSVNESLLTGESIPVDKSKDSNVSAATINISGYLKCQATRVGEDTTLSQIIKMVNDVAASKAPIAKLADRVAGVFVPSVVSIALITAVIWLLIGSGVGFALARAISVLVISCPCALGLATPVAIMVGNGVGAKNGILFKTAAILEETGRAKVVVLDKTGTITCGEPVVTDLICAPNVSEEALLTYAASLESLSEHPLSKAITSKASRMGIQVNKVTDFIINPGNGLEANCDNSNLVGGSFNYIASLVEVPSSMKKASEKMASEGKTPLLFAKDKTLLGLIAVADTIKEDSTKAIAKLKDMGLKVVMLTGDNEITAKAIGSQVAIDDVYSNILPSGKADVINSLKNQGKVIMVGDGINDAPALTSADVGIAIGSGADIAIDAADVVLVKSSLNDVCKAISLSRETLKIIKQNLFWAFFYNAIGIPIAAGCFVGLGLTLSPMFGAAAMSLSSFCVVSNALRLNLFKMREAIPNKEIKMKTVNMKIEGMMCSHCEARVKKALEAIAGVQSAEVSHQKGSAIVTIDNTVSTEVLVKAVTDDGYNVLFAE